MTANTITVPNKSKTEDEKPKAFEPIRFWLASPSHQTRVYIPGKRRPIRFHGGCYVARTQEEADIIRKSLPGEAFEEDWPEDKPVPVCQITGYAPRSFAAQEAYRRTLN